MYKHAIKGILGGNLGMSSWKSHKENWLHIIQYSFIAFIPFYISYPSPNDANLCVVYLSLREVWVETLMNSYAQILKHLQLNIYKTFRFVEKCAQADW